MNRENFNWNPVFNWVMKVKDEFMALPTVIEGEEHINFNTFMRHNHETGGKKEISCLEFWIECLNNNTYNDIITPLQINQKGNLILLRYGNYLSVKDGETENQTMWDEGFWDLYDGLYRECRSIVIDVKNEIIVNCPFRKFFNLNEKPETELEEIKNRITKAKSVEISEKIDGSMQCATYYNDEIILTGAQSVDENNSWRLQDGYKMLYNNENYIKMIKENPNWTFIFEYVSLLDAHVVKYTKEQEGLYLIGIRDKFTGEQYSYNFVLDIVKEYKIDKYMNIYNQTLDEVLQELDIYKSDEREGVVLFIDGFQVKIKYNDYVQIHRVLSAISSVNLVIEAVTDGWYDDLKSKVPSVYCDRIDKIYKIMMNYYQEMDKNVKYYYQLTMDNVNNNRKEFMIYVDENVPSKYRSYVRNMYLGQSFNYFKNKSGKYITAKELGLREEEKNL